MVSPERRIWSFIATFVTGDHESKTDSREFGIRLDNEPRVAFGASCGRSDHMIFSTPDISSGSASRVGAQGATNTSMQSTLAIPRGLVAGD